MYDTIKLHYGTYRIQFYRSLTVTNQTSRHIGV